MLKNYRNSIVTSGYAIIMATIFLLTAVSCRGIKEEGKKGHLIPEKDFVSILTDIHLADGLLIIPKIRNLYSERDSIKNYTDIIQSHGYTREELDRTIRYYYIKKPKKLIKVYDEVLGRLSAMETLLDQEIPANVIIGRNLWQGDSVYYCPGPPGGDSLMFDHTLEPFGYYSLSFTLTLYPDDLSLNPHFSAYFCNPDSIDTGKREYYPSIFLLKDGRPHKFTFSRKPHMKSYTHLRGWLIDCDNRAGKVESHFRIDNISLTCIPSSP